MGSKKTILGAVAAASLVTGGLLFVTVKDGREGRVSGSRAIRISTRDPGATVGDTTREHARNVASRW